VARPKKDMPTRNSPAAQVLVAWLLQGLGDRYDDERMKAEGEKLARPISRDDLAPVQQQGNVTFH
jgi:hypothetical protein